MTTSTPLPSEVIRDEDALVTTVLRTVIGAGCVWCGAVLSLAFGHAENVRWWSLLAGAPTFAAFGVSFFASPSPRRVKALLALTASAGLVLLFCVGLVLAGFAPLSEEGRWKRALAAVSTVAIVLEVRRLLALRSASARPQPSRSTTPHPTVLSLGSFDDLVSERAAALGTTREALLQQLEHAIAKAAPNHFKTKARFEVAWEPLRHTFSVNAVVDASGLPGAEPGDEAAFAVFWSPEQHEQARAQDREHAATLGFTTVDSGFELVVDAAAREVLGLPVAGPLELLRDEWLRLMNQALFVLRDTGTKYSVELMTTSDAQPQPIGGKRIYDLALEGPKVNDFRANPRTLDTTLDLGGQPLRVGTQRWDAMTLSVLGQPDLTTLKAWTARWMANADTAPEGQLAGVVHHVELVRYTTGCTLTLDLGSAPVSALEELVVLLRPFGAVSLDDAVVRALADRPFQGGLDDLVPLVRLEEHAVSHHLVGPLWVSYALESKHALAAISPADLDRLGLDPNAVHDLALANLRRRLAPPLVTGHSGAFMLTLPGEGGHFEASLLLLDEVWDRVAPLVKGDVVVSLPCRDLLFVTGTNEPEGLKKVRGMAADTLEKHLEHPVTQQLFVRREGTWRPFATA